MKRAPTAFPVHCPLSGTPLTLNTGRTPDCQDWGARGCAVQEGRGTSTDQQAESPDRAVVDQGAELCLGARPAQAGPHLRNAEVIRLARSARVPKRESGCPAIGAQSATSRSSRIGGKAVRHVNALNGDVSTILLKAPCEGWLRRMGTGGSR